VLQVAHPEQTIGQSGYALLPQMGRTCFEPPGKPPTGQVASDWLVADLAHRPSDTGQADLQWSVELVAAIDPERRMARQYVEVSVEVQDRRVSRMAIAVMRQSINFRGVSPLRRQIR